MERLITAAPEGWKKPHIAAYSCHLIGRGLILRAPCLPDHPGGPWVDTSDTDPAASPLGRLLRPVSFGAGEHLGMKARR